MSNVSSSRNVYFVDGWIFVLCCSATLALFCNETFAEALLLHLVVSQTMGSEFYPPFIPRPTSPRPSAHAPFYPTSHAPLTKFYPHPYLLHTPSPTSIPHNNPAHHRFVESIGLAV